MSDMGFQDDMSEEDLADPVEREQLNSLQQIVQALSGVIQGLQVVAQQNAQIAQLLAAERVTESVGRDGRKMQAISRLKG